MSETSPPDTSALAAGVILLLRKLLSGWKDLPMAGAALLSLATRKREVFELRDRLQEILPIVLDDSQWETPTGCDTPTIKVMVVVRDYMMHHVDAVCDTDGCCIYSDGFRRCVAALVDPGQPGEAMSLVELAYATGVPEDVLKDWLDSSIRPATS